ncbi:unnamed protein product [Sphagnum balticum]
MSITAAVLMALIAIIDATDNVNTSSARQPRGYSYNPPPTQDDSNEIGDLEQPSNCPFYKQKKLNFMRFRRSDAATSNAWRTGRVPGRGRLPVADVLRQVGLLRCGSRVLRRW